MPSLRTCIWLAGGLILTSTVTLTVTQAPLGSPLFFGLAAVMALAYAAVLARAWRTPPLAPRLLLAALPLRSPSGCR